jgi:UDP-glucose 4-epimerase
MKRRIVITGAFGFIGRHAARAAAREGYLAVGIGRRGSSPAVTGTGEWGLRECRDEAITPEALAALESGPDVILHCAGSGSIAAASESPLASLADNIVTTSSVLEYARLCEKRPRVVLISSAAVYGEAGAGNIAEAQPVRPISVYGTHKVLAEDMGRWYGREYRIPISIVRLFSIYGPGLRREILWEACRRASASAPRFEGTGAEVRDFLHVEDAAKLLLMAVGQASPACPIFNGGTGRGTAIHQALAEICRKLGAPAPEFSGAAIAQEPRSQIAEIERVHRLGFYPQVNWQAGLEEYIAWYLSNLSTERQAA